MLFRSSLSGHGCRDGCAGQKSCQIQLPGGVVPGLHCTAGRTSILCVGTAAAGTIRTTSAGAVPGAIGIISAGTVTGAVGVISIIRVVSVVGIAAVLTAVVVVTVVVVPVVAVSTVLVAIVPFIIIVPRIDRRFFLGLG